MSRDRYCTCVGVCGYDDPDYADECVEAGCVYCVDAHAQRELEFARPLGEVPLFGGDAAPALFGGGEVA